MRAFYLYNESVELDPEVSMHLVSLHPFADDHTVIVHHLVRFLVVVVRLTLELPLWVIITLGVRLVIGVVVAIISRTRCRSSSLGTSVSASTSVLYRFPNPFGSTIAPVSHAAHHRIPHGTTE